jgi:plastocyanin
LRVSAGLSPDFATTCDPDRSLRRVRKLLAVPVIALMAAAIGLLIAGRSSDPTSDITFTIPAGTQARLDAGEQVEVLPATIAVERGAAVVIENDDAVTHTAGPFTVPAGAQVRQRFDELGTFTSSCSLHPSGELTIVVR